MAAGDWEPAFHERFREEERGGLTIAGLDDALTFARVVTASGTRVIAVTAWRGGSVEGVDLTALLSGGAAQLAGGAAQLAGDAAGAAAPIASAAAPVASAAAPLASAVAPIAGAAAPVGRNVSDPITLFQERGYDRLRDDVSSAPPAMRVTVAVGDLVLPVDLGDRHIAVGTNYPEHAHDAGTTRPFLFPKLVQPGISGDPVSVRGGLLDYEVEIVVVPLEPLAEGEAPRFLGLMVANDFTDRETLMHEVDRHDVESGKGFTTGKSFPGYLPVGALFVIPHDYRTFARGIELRLFVNDGLRQRSMASEMVWDIDEILAQTFARRKVRWQHRGLEVPLFEGEAIPARTLILTGTPHGTVFSGVPTRVMATGLLRWLLGGWSKGVPACVIDAYADSAREARAFLQPGDEVRIHVQGLGEIVSTVVP